MKCRFCNSNLDIDAAVCPYCGKENPVAKKHREDMAKYTADYKATKEDVLKNSRKFTGKTFKVAALAVTVTAFVIMICLVIFNDRLGRDIARAKRDKENEQYTPRVMSLIEEEEYLELTRFISAKNISYYAIPELTDVYEIVHVANSYTKIFNELIEMTTANGVRSTYTVDNINEGLRVMYKYCGLQKDSELYTKFCADAKRDTLLLLEYYLDMPKEKTEALETMTDGQRILAIEEAYNAKIQK